MDAASSPVAIVTGANRGLGLETSRQLARQGFRVLIASRTSDGASAAEGLARQGLEVAHVPLDVTSPDSIAALADRLAREGVAVDVLVNNAGISMAGFDAEVARATLEVNFFGALHVTEALLPRLRDGARIVMVSSGLGELAGLGPAARAKLLDPTLTRQSLATLMRAFVADVARGRHVEAGWPSSAYAVSKAGLNALVRVLAVELAGRRVAVNAVCPGWVRTDMGGRGAPRSVEEGARSVIWAAVSNDGATGGFFRDGRRIDW